MRLQKALDTLPNPLVDWQAEIWAPKVFGISWQLCIVFQGRYSETPIIRDLVPEPNYAWARALLGHLNIAPRGALK